ncbi:sel1 repeat family protein [Catenovulum agarivorans]|uniref:sel1 repeat family protein n=1 Tax=Catenovulum agarivorans TaxID=1172192 RepID=UPI00037A3B45|nr:sel1 repeat family protein [Catenovulum agarivorans]
MVKISGIRLGILALRQLAKQQSIMTMNTNSSIWVTSSALFFLLLCSFPLEAFKSSDSNLRDSCKNLYKLEIELLETTDRQRLLSLTDEYLNYSASCIEQLPRILQSVVNIIISHSLEDEKLKKRVEDLLIEFGKLNGDRLNEFLGRLYVFSQYSAEKKEIGVSLLEKSARNGEINSHYLLATYYHRIANYELAGKHYKFAANANHLEARLMLNQMKMYSLITSGAWESIYHEFSSLAVIEKYPKASYFLYKLYSEFSEGREFMSEEQAIAHLKAAAQANIEDALFSLGSYYFSLFAETDDVRYIELAYQNIYKSHKLGLTKAAHSLGLISLVAGDKDSACGYFEVSIIQGYGKSKPKYDEFCEDR